MCLMCFWYVYMFLLCLFVFEAVFRVVVRFGAFSKFILGVVWFPSFFVCMMCFSCFVIEFDWFL